MSSDILKAFVISLGFSIDKPSSTAAIKELMDYERHLRKLDEEEKKIEKEAKERAKQAAKEAVEEEKRKQLARQHAIDGLKAFAVAAAAASAAAVLALGKITGAFDELYFASRRTGASAQNLKALSYAFTQVGGKGEEASSAIESFAKAMRTNPSALTHSDGAALPLTALRMAAAGLVQTKGFGLWLCSAM